jgi:hypothetical protein
MSTGGVWVAIDTDPGVIPAPHREKRTHGPSIGFRDNPRRHMAAAALTLPATPTATFEVYLPRRTCAPGRFGVEGSSQAPFAIRRNSTHLKGRARRPKPPRRLGVNVGGSP